MNLRSTVHQYSHVKEPTYNTKDAKISSDISQPTAGTPQTADVSRYVRRFGFNIGSYHMLAPHGLFCEYIVDAHISPLPNSPPHVEGLVNIRGNIVPTYSINELLNQQKIHSNFAYLLGPPEDGAALIVSGKPELVDITDHSPTNQYPENIPDILLSCINAVYTIQGIRWFSIDHERLFSILAEKV